MTVANAYVNSQAIITDHQEMYDAIEKGMKNWLNT